MHATTYQTRHGDTDRGHARDLPFLGSDRPTFEIVGAGTGAPSLSVRNAYGEEIERLSVNEDFVAVLAQDFGKGRFYVGFQGANGVSFDLVEILEAVETSCPELFPASTPAR